MIIIPQWAVTINFQDGSHMNFSISDHHYGNVLTFLSKIHFYGAVFSIEVCMRETATSGSNLTTKTS